YHSIFLSAILLAGAYAAPEGSVGDGRFDAHYKAPNKSDFLFEVKYCPLERPPGGRKPLSEKEAKTMESAAKEAMKQIEDRNYTKHFLGVGVPVYKVALVVAGHTEVLAVFEREKDD
ncbi:MAG: PD-(D/E)XK nuclease domain-containing protein, partial [Deltaproteobacteria bacterium]|nr:PD-(D/E)XK nuclease domain-containing protein [Deltaproteobacteria bacterium]